MAAAVPAEASASAGAPVPTTMSEKMAPFMDEPLRGFVRELPRIIDALNVQPGAHVADVGAGTGVVTEALAKAVTRGGAQGGRVYALDISQFFLQGLRTRKERISATDPAAAAAIHVHPCGERDLGEGIPDGSLDLLILTDVFHHLPDAASTVRAVARALKPVTGRVAVIESDRRKFMETFARTNTEAFQQMLRENMKQRAQAQAQGQTHGHGHGHSHGGAEGHSHAADHSHGHGHSHAGAEAAAGPPQIPAEGTLSTEAAVAMARKMVASIPPEDPARIRTLMHESGLAFHTDINPAGAISDDIDIALVFIKAAPTTTAA